MLKIRTYAFIIFLAFELALLYMQFEAYQSAPETVTISQLGYFNIPKDALLLELVSSVIMIPYTAIHTIGALLEAEWLFQVRLWAAVTAILICIAWAFLPKHGFLSLADAAFLYLLAEGAITILEEGLRRG